MRKLISIFFLLACSLVAQTVSISPSTPSNVIQGGTKQFTATVTGGTLNTVTWSVTGSGTVSSTGLYTAPSSVTTHTTDTVTATSVDNSAKTASSWVVLDTGTSTFTVYSTSMSGYAAGGGTSSPPTNSSVSYWYTGSWSSLKVGAYYVKASNYFWNYVGVIQFATNTLPDGVYVSRATLTMYSGGGTNTIGCGAHQWGIGWYTGALDSTAFTVTANSSAWGPSTTSPSANGGSAFPDYELSDPNSNVSSTAATKLRFVYSSASLTTSADAQCAENYTEGNGTSNLPTLKVYYSTYPPVAPTTRPRLIVVNQ